VKIPPSPKVGRRVQGQFSSKSKVGLLIQEMFPLRRTVVDCEFALEIPALYSRLPGTFRPPGDLGKCTGIEVIELFGAKIFAPYMVIPVPSFYRNPRFCPRIAPCSFPGSQSHKI